MDPPSTDPPDPSGDATAGGPSANPSSSSEDSFSLYSAIFLAGVYGSNIGPPGTAPGGSEAAKARACIKPWHQRLDVGEWTESLEGGSVSADWATQREESAV